MRTLPYRSLAVLLALAAFTACADTPTGTAAPTTVRAAQTGLGNIRHVDAYEFDVTDRTLQLGCTDGTLGEIVRLSGTVVERVTSMQLPTGTYIYRRDEQDRDLTGIGLESGDAYDVERRVHDGDRYGDRGILGTHREHWSLRNRRTGDVHALTYRVHYAMDAERDLLYDRQWETVRCP